MQEQADFRLFLQGELVRRIKANSGYSMRAFAKFLGIEASRLSKMLRAQRPIKPEFIERFGQKIGLKPTDIEKFKLKALGDKHRIETRYMQLSQDEFEVISDWQHYAILELMKLKNFDQSPKWIAKKLSITTNEVVAAVERLQRVGLLKVDSENCWVDISNGFSSHVLSNNYTSYAHKKHQDQILDRAKQALNEIPIENRDQSSIMMATSAKRICEAKEMIKEFRYKLCEFLEQAEIKDSIYQLSVSLFPLTELNEKIVSGGNHEIVSEGN